MSRRKNRRQWAALCCIILLLGLPGCAPKLHPLLAKNLGRELSLEKEVDVKVIVAGFWGTQAACFKEDPLSVLLRGVVLGCATMSCAVNKMWETEKICTCIVHLAFDSKDLLAHELNHCKGFIHHVYEQESRQAHGLAQCPGSTHLTFEHDELFVHLSPQSRSADQFAAGKGKPRPQEFEQCRELSWPESGMSCAFPILSDLRDAK